MAHEHGARTADHAAASTSNCRAYPHNLATPEITGVAGAAARFLFLCIPTLTGCCPHMTAGAAGALLSL